MSNFDYTNHFMNLLFVHFRGSAGTAQKSTITIVLSNRCKCADDGV